MSRYIGATLVILIGLALGAMVGAIIERVNGLISNANKSELAPQGLHHLGLSQPHDGVE